MTNHEDQRPFFGTMALAGKGRLSYGRNLLFGTLAVINACGNSCRAFGDKTVSLSSLDLSGPRQNWGSPQVNKSVEGHPLSVSGKKFQTGLGTHLLLKSVPFYDKCPINC